MSMNAKALMFLGTGSDVGKSVLAAAYCRILRQEGFRVAPFKAQNMALNSFITPEGGEMGRAQVVQAEAAGLAPHVDMNPILLKPTCQMGSQVIVRGRSVGNYSALEYYHFKKELVSVVRESYERLASRYEVIVIEGAGSAVELNLREHDLVNLSMAAMADARCVLVGDIDRGGIFAALLGSTMLMTPEERARITGFMVNKLRGDPRLFANGIDIIESRSGLPVLGVIPHFDHIALQEEDSVALKRRMERGSRGQEEGAASLRIGVVRLPFISNYTDFDCFEQEPGVGLVYFDGPRRVFDFDAIILPGSKNTLEDLAYLKRTGLAEALMAFLKSGGTVVGLCGGYQMLGRSVRDPHGVESGLREVAGLGLLDMETEMFQDKITSQVEAEVLDGLGLGDSRIERVTGYEIHMGRSTPGEGAQPLFRIVRRDGKAANVEDGLHGADGRVWGTYIHGVFDGDGFRRGFLRSLGLRSGKEEIPLSDGYSYSEWKERQYELLADHARRHTDVRRIIDALGL
ncbi:MAG: cobyric acid synthase [Syntrophobacteraceae bacterium]|jgi:adenosylcobyric acid synthase|nr:cobyric acid synthase [Syntrophobacteraceae bacterium]